MPLFSLSDNSTTNSVESLPLFPPPLKRNEQPRNSSLSRTSQSPPGPSGATSSWPSYAASRRPAASRPSCPSQRTSRTTTPRTTSPASERRGGRVLSSLRFGSKRAAAPVPQKKRARAWPAFVAAGSVAARLCIVELTLHDVASVNRIRSTDHGWDSGRRGGAGQFQQGEQDHADGGAAQSTPGRGARARTWRGRISSIPSSNHSLNAELFVGTEGPWCVPPCPSRPAEGAGDGERH